MTLDGPRLAGLTGDLVVALHAAAAHGFTEGIDNHFSLMAGPGKMLINCYGTLWECIGSESIACVDVDAGHHPAVDASALAIHASLHRLRRDALAVFHTHMPFATAVACSSRPFIENLSQSSVYFKDRICSVAYNGFGAVGQESERLASALGPGTSVAFLRNHGVLVVGRSAADAWHKLYMLERACRLQILAAPDWEPMPDDVASVTRDQWHAIESSVADELFAALKAKYGDPRPATNAPVAP